jgi:hypothetical protein
MAIAPVTKPAAGIFVIVLVMFDLFLSFGKTMPWK